MRGPIDFIVVGFKDKTFDGTILQTVIEAVENKTINVLEMAVIQKDSEGRLALMDAQQLGDKMVMHLMQDIEPTSVHIGEDDIQEVGELVENNTAIGLLVIEQLWAKPLKQAIVKAHGVLIAEGRIHPEVAQELNQQVNM